MSKPGFRLSSFKPERKVSRLYFFSWRLCNAVVFSDLLPFYALRRFALRCFGAKVGRNVKMRSGILIYNPKELYIGHGSWVGDRCNINNPAPLYIASNVAIAHEVFIACGSHDFNAPNFPPRHSPIKIGSGTWIASRSVILSNAHIWRCIVGAGVLVPGKTYKQKILKLSAKNLCVVDRKPH